VLRSADAISPGLGETVGVFSNDHPQVEMASNGVGVSSNKAIGSPFRNESCQTQHLQPRRCMRVYHAK
jgi:hypothetical protein